jgi:hypothetical protein
VLLQLLLLLLLGAQLWQAWVLQLPLQGGVSGLQRRWLWQVCLLQLPAAHACL